MNNNPVPQHVLDKLNQMVLNQAKELQAYAKERPSALEKTVIELAMAKFMSEFIKLFLCFNKAERDMLMRFINETHKAVEEAVEETNNKRRSNETT